MTDHYGKSILEEPIRWSRWARFKAWWRGYALPVTVMDAQRQHAAGIAQTLEYSHRSSASGTDAS